MSISPRTPINSYLTILPWKYKTKVMGGGGGGGGGGRWKSHGFESHMGPTFYRLTSLSFQVNRSSLSWPDIGLFSNLTLIIQSQCHGWGKSWKSQAACSILSTHLLFVPCQSAIPFLRYDFFQTWPWKSKVKFMVEVKVEGHKVGVIFYRRTSLSNYPSIPETQTFLNLTFKSKVKVKWQWCCTTTGLHNSI